MRTAIIALSSTVSFFSLLGIIIVAKSFGFSPANFHDPDKVFDSLTILTALAVMILPILITILTQKIILKEPLSRIGVERGFSKPFIAGAGIGSLLKIIATTGAFLSSSNVSISLVEIPVGLMEYLPFIFWFLIALLLNSLSEELVYRSFPIANLSRNNRNFSVALGFLWAMAFSLAHFFIEPVDLIRFFYRLSFGLVAALMFIKTKSLWKIVGLHTGWNLIALSVSESDWRTGNILQMVGVSDHMESIANIVVLTVFSIFYLGILYRTKEGPHA